jgi:hypothetical protein
MSRGRLSTARFATVLAIILALFVTGVVAGAAGSSLIIGSEANNAGTANTQLLTNSNVVAFKLYQQGPGTALMGYTTPLTGATRGVYGRVDSPNGDGVQARNGAASGGTGAALRAIGGANPGVVATSDGTWAVAGTASASLGVGIYGVAGSPAGVAIPNRIGVVGTSATGPGMAGISGSNVGVYGISNSSDGARFSSSSGYAARFQGAPIQVESYLEVAEIADPEVAPADSARIFVRDNGSSKTQLCIRFPSGAVQVIATEP